MDLGYATDAIFFFDKSIYLEQKRIKTLFTKRELARVWTNKGRALSFLKQNEDAIQACKKAAELDKKLSFTWQTLGNIYSKISDYDNATAAFNKAIETNRRWALSSSHFSYQ